MIVITPGSSLISKITCEIFTRIFMFAGATIIWKNTAGLYHREHGPAIVSSGGGKEWYINGQRHRENGPAIIYADGLQTWYLNNLPHRLDGPSYIDREGTILWYVNGNNISDEVFPWMLDMNICVDWTTWTDKEKLWFKLRFG